MVPPDTNGSVYLFKRSAKALKAAFPIGSLRSLMVLDVRPNP
jgi:hypothetical protein